MNARWITVIAAVVMVVAMGTARLFADEPNGEPKLVNATKVFPASQPVYKSPWLPYEFAMRLSPDGKRLLYTRPVEGTDPEDSRTNRFELVLRELAGGKETVLPLEPLNSSWRNTLTRFNMFDQAGTRLALVNFTTKVTRADEHGSSSEITAHWFLYDIQKDKSGDITFATRVASPAKFTPDGTSMLIADAIGSREMAVKQFSLNDPKAKPKTLAATGMAWSVCPPGDPKQPQKGAQVAVVFVPSPKPVGEPPDDWHKTKPPSRLLLWDLKADKELAEVPTHRRVMDLGIIVEPQWTADGRYLYYMDAEEIATKEKAKDPTIRTVTRIWDRQAGKPAGVVPNAVPVGAGPGRWMILSERTTEGPLGFLLYDAVAGKEYPLGSPSQKLIHAWGNKVLYAEKSDDSDTEDVFVAEMVIPKGLDKAP